MIISSNTNYQFPVNCLERILPELSFTCKFDKESGIFIPKLELSKSPDFSASAEIEIPQGSLFTENHDINFTNDEENTSSEFEVPISHSTIDVILKNIPITDGYLPLHLGNQTYLYCRVVFYKRNAENRLVVINKSQYFILSFLDKMTLFIENDKIYKKPIKAIDLILDHRIYGNPIIKVSVSNGIGNEDNKWFDVTDKVINSSDYIIFDNITNDINEEVFHVSIKLEVTKTTNNDHYQFFGYLLSVLESEFYKK